VFHLEHLNDYGLLLMRIMVGLIYAGSCYDDLVILFTNGGRFVVVR
jgi:hypothetical protein